MKLLLGLLLMVVSLAAAGQADPRWCGEPARTASGAIKRSAAAKAEFSRLYACPSTGLHKASCPGWAIDHVVPLSCGGCDTPVNMQWLPLPIKSCSSEACKDRWERKVYETSIPCR